MLAQLTLTGFRNLKEQTFYPGQHINLVIGENGSGKTSLLESIYLLGMGRSFRTRALKHVIQSEKNQLTVFAKTADKTPIGFQYSLNSGAQFRLNAAPLSKLSDLASHLPLQLIPANCHLFFEQGPKYRRQILDWGVFHVKHDFNFHWQSYKKSLSQRNAALKSAKLKDSEISLWDKNLVHHGEKISAYREEYLAKLFSIFKPIFIQLCEEFAASSFQLRFKKGWLKESEFSDILHQHLAKDRLLGYTRNGPHASDWMIRIDGANPVELLSRGQQKLFFLAICLAQIEILKKEKDISNTILLIDDLSSELDENKQANVLKMLESLQVQCFISSTNHKLAEYIQKSCTVFHVKHGQIEQELLELSSERET